MSTALRRTFGLAFAVGTAAYAAYSMWQMYQRRRKQATADQPAHSATSAGPDCPLEEVSSASDNAADTPSMSPVHQVSELPCAETGCNTELLPTIANQVKLIDAQDVVAVDLYENKELSLSDYVKEYFVLTTGHPFLPSKRFDHLRCSSYKRECLFEMFKVRASNRQAPKDLAPRTMSSDVAEVGDLASCSCVASSDIVVGVTKPKFDTTTTTSHAADFGTGENTAPGVTQVAAQQAEPEADGQSSVPAMLEANKRVIKGKADGHEDDSNQHSDEPATVHIDTIKIDKQGASTADLPSNEITVANSTVDSDIKTDLRAAEKFRIKGNKLFNDMRHKDAFAAYANYLKYLPKGHKEVPQAHYHFATAHMKLGNLPVAIEHLTTAINLQPNFSKALICRSSAFDELGKYHDAFVDLIWSTASDSPKQMSAKLVQMRSILYKHVKFETQSAFASNSAAPMSPSDGLLFLRSFAGEYAKLFACDDKLSVALTSLKEALRSDSWADVLAFANLATGTDFGNAPASELFWYAAVCYIKGELPTARSILEDGIKICPHSAPLYILHGRTMFDLGFSNEAIQSFNRATEMSRSSEEVYFHRGVILWKWNRKDEALADFSNALKLNPHSVHARAYLTFLQNSLSREAISVLEPAFLQCNIDPLTCVSIAVQLLAIGHNARARQLYDTAVCRDPNNATLYVMYWEAMFKHGQTPEANYIDELEKIAHKSPQHAYAHFKLGIMYLKHSDFDRAHTAFNTAICGVRSTFDANVVNLHISIVKAFIKCKQYRIPCDELTHDLTKDAHYMPLC